jgi:hypothetical protein
MDPNQPDPAAYYTPLSATPNADPDYSSDDDFEDELELEKLPQTQSVHNIITYIAYTDNYRLSIAVSLVSKYITQVSWLLRWIWSYMYLLECM